MRTDCKQIVGEGGSRKQIGNQRVSRGARQRMGAIEDDGPARGWAGDPGVHSKPRTDEHGGAGLAANLVVAPARAGNRPGTWSSPISSSGMRTASKSGDDKVGDSHRAAPARAGQQYLSTESCGAGQPFCGGAGMREAPPSAQSERAGLGAPIMRCPVAPPERSPSRRGSTTRHCPVRPSRPDQGRSAARDPGPSGHKDRYLPPASLLAGRG